MSGIASIYHMDGQSIDPADLEHLAIALNHQGRDGSGIWHQSPVGLVHRLLWTTPASRQEKPPLVNRAGDLVLSAEARIDIREEFIRVLELDERPSKRIDLEGSSFRDTPTRKTLDLKTLTP